MKKVLFLFLFFIFLLSKSNAHNAELRIILTNYGTSWNVTIKAYAVSDRWDENYNLTSSHYSRSQVIPESGSPGNYTAIFDLVVDNDAGTNPILALGKYRIEAWENNSRQTYFFVDYRTSDYGISPDIDFKYDETNNKFMNSAGTANIDQTTQKVWNLVQGIDQITTNLEPQVPISLTYYGPEQGRPLIGWTVSSEIIMRIIIM